MGAQESSEAVSWTAKIDELERMFFHLRGESGIADSLLEELPEDLPGRVGRLEQLLADEQGKHVEVREHLELLKMSYPSFFRDDHGFSERFYDALARSDPHGDKDGASCVSTAVGTTDSLRSSGRRSLQSISSVRASTFHDEGEHCGSGRVVLDCGSAEEFPRVSWTEESLQRCASSSELDPLGVLAWAEFNRS